MKSSAEECFICGGSLADTPSDYMRCRLCGHEILKRGVAGAAIVNDILSLEEVRRVTALDRFKIRVALDGTRPRGLLVDIGSASGKFLYQCKGMFDDLIGIEVSPECLEFSRNTLGLKVDEDISALRQEASVATLWHSMEHMPPAVLRKVLDAMAAHSGPDTRVVASVPNSGSLQYRMFGRRYAYYDCPAHIHQFSPGSLDRLMAAHGFHRVRDYRSFAYSAFGYLQGMLNVFNSTHNYMYYRKKRGWDYGRGRMALLAGDLYNIALAAALALPALALTMFDAVIPRAGGVLTSCYMKRTP